MVKILFQGGGGCTRPKILGGYVNLLPPQKISSFRSACDLKAEIFRKYASIPQIYTLKITAS